MPETLDVVFSPYGVDPESNQAYPPHPTQREILDWVHSVREGKLKTQGIPVLYLQHGVDAGGTRAILAPVVECLFEYPGIRILDGRKDFNDLRLSAMETFEEIVPRDLILSRDNQEHRYSILAKGGSSTIFFRELKDVRGLGSQEFAIIVVHEAHEIDIVAYRTLKQRCRQSGYPLMILMEGNPPSQGHWLEQILDPKSLEYDSDITRIILSSYENWNFMNPAYRASLESMPPAWRKRYLLGETAALPSGTPVYPAFVEAVHVRETRIIPDRPIIRSMDFGFRRAACLWSQLEDSGKLLIHKEWMALETPEDQFIDGVILRTNAWFGQRPCKDYGDPAARNRDPNGVATLDRLQKKGIQLFYQQTTYSQRIPLVNRKLSEMISGEPAILLDPSCRILIEGLSGGYHYEEMKEGQEFTVKRDLPFHDSWFSHTANAFEYLIVNLYGHSAPAVSKFISRKKNRMRMLANAKSPGVWF